MHTQNAFSLLEVLIVLALSAMLTMISLPFLQDIGLNFQYRLLQTQLLHTITFARTAAKIHRSQIILCKSKDSHHCSGNWSDGQLIYVDKGDGILHEEQQILKVMHFSVKKGVIHWRSFPYYREYVRFAPSELTHQDNGTFWYCDDHSKTAQWAIILNQTGRARVVNRDRNGVIKDGSGKILTC